MEEINTQQKNYAKLKVDPESVSNCGFARLFTCLISEPFLLDDDFC